MSQSLPPPPPLLLLQQLLLLLVIRQHLLCALYKPIEFYEVGAIINTVFQISKPVHKEVKEFILTFPHPIHPTLTLDNGAQTWRSSGEPQEGEGSSAPRRAPEHTHQQLPAGESRPHSASLPCSSANTHCRCLCLFSRKIWRPYIGTLLARSRWRKHLPVPPRAHPHPGASVRGR